MQNKRLSCNPKEATIGLTMGDMLSMSTSPQETGLGLLALKALIAGRSVSKYMNLGKMHTQQGHLGSVKHTCFGPARPSTAPPRRILIQTRAQKTESPLDKVKGLFGKVTNGGAEEEDRFKYDFANSRWVRGWF